MTFDLGKRVGAGASCSPSRGCCGLAKEGTKAYCVESCGVGCQLLTGPNFKGTPRGGCARMTGRGRTARPDHGMARHTS